MKFFDNIGLFIIYVFVFVIFRNEYIVINSVYIG